MKKRSLIFKIENEMKANRFFTYFCLVLFAGTVFGCSDEIPVYDITEVPYVNKTVLDMYTGDEVQLKSSPAGVSYTWSSDNEAVVGVTQTGLVKALGEGYALITVASSSDKTTVEVRVKTFVPLTDINVSATSLRMYVGDETQVSASAVPANASEVAFVWRSENPEVATVTNKGVITAASAGSARITVSSGSVTSALEVVIREAPTLLPKAELTVIAWSDAYTGGGNDGGGVASLIDNNYGTPAWHSGRGGDYGASSFPYWFIIDMGSSREITKIVTRFSNTDRTARMTCYISNSNSITTRGDSDSPITDPEACAAWGTKISDTEEWNDAISTVNMLSNATTGQYLLLYMYEAGPNDGDHHTNIYEIDVYGF
jgi:hypothetical protein